MQNTIKRILSLHYMVNRLQLLKIPLCYLRSNLQGEMCTHLLRPSQRDTFPAGKTWMGASWITRLPGEVDLFVSEASIPLTDTASHVVLDQQFSEVASLGLVENSRILSLPT